METTKNNKNPNKSHVFYSQILAFQFSFRRFELALFSSILTFQLSFRRFELA